MNATTTAAPDDEPTCTSCGGTGAGCRLRLFCSGRRCCPDCTHNSPIEGDQP